MTTTSTESRYLQSEQVTDEAGRLVLVDREPFEFRQLDDTILHEVAEGESWWSLAELYYSEISARACGLWWVIADFQPQAVVDPTRKIANGRIVFVPSPVVVLTEIFDQPVEVFL